MKWLIRIYIDYFKIYTTVTPKHRTEQHPECNIVWMKGKKRKKIIDIQYTS